MAEPKTKAEKTSVEGFLASVEPEQRRLDGLELCAIFSAVTGEPPVMWGAAIVGFGSYRYVGANGRAGEWPLTGFSPRKANLSLYIMPGFDEYAALMAKLGPYKTGKSCLYLKDLKKVDPEALAALIAASVKDMRQRYPQ
jgi:hypothetical protein